MPEEDASKPIPVLTDVVAKELELACAAEADAAHDTESLIAELQTQIAANAFGLTEKVLHTAFAEMEASLYEQITTRLRRELPELIDKILREHLSEEPEET